MNERIIFENAGEIDSLMITTFGVNVKESDDAIGFFGTGLKYSIAILARLGIPIQIHSGETVHTFSKKQVTLRGKDFEFVAMDGVALGFTTEVGKKWELWMAYRELFCNTKDEGGRVYESDEIPEPEAGITRVIVSGADFMSVRNQHSIYFLNSSPFIVSGDMEVHRGTCCHVFYKGVAVGPVSEKHGLLKVDNRFLRLTPTHRGQLAADDIFNRQRQVFPARQVKVTNIVTVIHAAIISHYHHLHSQVQCRPECLTARWTVRKRAIVATPRTPSTVPSRLKAVFPPPSGRFQSCETP